LLFLKQSPVEGRGKLEALKSGILFAAEKCVLSLFTGG
jgi:hypothetical protein